MSQHLTDAVVRRLPAPDKGKKIYPDDEVAGLGVRVTAAGARSYVLRYVTRAGRERTYTIGDIGDWRATAARADARRLRQIVDQGGDPMADIEAERAAPTVADLIARFEQEHLPYLRPSSRADYRRMIANHIRPHFGAHLKVSDVRFEDVQRLHDRITGAGHLHRANRVIAVVSKMFALAAHWRMRADNPARGVKRHYESKRTRYLDSEHELPRLLTALAEHEDQQAADIVRLALLSGARRGEILSARWADLDLSRGTWIKPGSTTKQKTTHIAPLSAAARQLLSEIADRYAREHPRQPLGTFVFPSRQSGVGHVTELKRPWRAITKAAGIEGLRFHDLRHSFASFLASGGASLPLIGSLLGHSNPVTTHRYTHLADTPQRAAVDRVAAIIDAAGRLPPADVTPLKPKRGRQP
ncbi:MAG: tyrosine-type recombinase/integrase [Hyphomicrobium sp.]